MLSKATFIDILPLFRRYRLDFDLFGYSPDEYIAVGRPDPDDTTTAQPAEARHFVVV
jgi:hypothetical protein